MKHVIKSTLDTSHVPLEPVSSGESAAQMAAYLVEEAEHLLRIGFYRPAAASARAALEMTLVAACKNWNCWPINPRTGMPFRRHGSSERLVKALVEAGKLDEKLIKKIWLGIRIGNRAAHAVPITIADAFMAMACAHEAQGLIPKRRRFTRTSVY